MDAWTFPHGREVPNRLVACILSVQYFNGPYRWRGANFIRATPETCWNRLIQWQLYTEEELLHRRDKLVWELFQIDLGGNKLEIIGSHLLIKTEEDYKESRRSDTKG